MTVIARRRMLSGLAALHLVVPSAHAQPARRVPRIGWLTAQQPASLEPYVDALRAELAELGYVDGRTIALNFRHGNDDAARVPALARELVDLPVDLLVAQGAAVYRIAKLGLPVPIVFVVSSDPVISGLADSLSQPRGNMTGLTFMRFEFAAKRIELFQEIMPGIRKIAVLGNPEHAGFDVEKSYSAEAGRRMGLQIDYHLTATPDQLAQVLRGFAASPPQAISLLADGWAMQNRHSILKFAAQQGIAVCSGWPAFAQSGALFTYGPRLTDSYRRLAAYVARVLEGAKPADLPIERPTRFEFIVNMATARALGITIPRSILARADEVVG